MLHTTLRFVVRTASRFPLALSLALVLVLPFGYYPDYPDSASFEVGLYGGYGQIASVIRDCSGHPIDAHGNTFQDVSGAGYARVPVFGSSYLVAGVRGGYWRSSARFAENPNYYPIDRPTSSHVEYSYINPCISIEGKYVGFGIGYMHGSMPTQFEELDDPPEERPENLVTSHLRLGNAANVYFLTSFGESVPLASGGGFLGMGFGYPAGSKTRLYTGLSMLPYDAYDLGVVQQVEVRMNRDFRAQFAARVGQAAGIFEGALSAGLVFQFGSRGR